MSLKYRITYENSYAQYTSQKNSRKLICAMLPFMLCAALVLFLLFTTEMSTFHNLFLPGNPQVTNKAFSELVEAMDRGEPLFTALDIFCKNVMAVR